MRGKLRPHGPGVAALTIALAAPTVAVPSLDAQELRRFVVTGIVIDSERDRPVPGVRVIVPDIGRVLVTDAEGSFTLPPLFEGRYPMRLVRQGYDQIDGDLEVFENGEFTVEMDPIRDYEAGGRLQGIVTDAAGGAPVPAVSIRLGAQGPSGETDADGRFAFRGLEPGTYRVRVGALGYAERVETIQVRTGRIAHVEIRLTPDPVELESLDVTVEERWLALDLSGFYRRRDEGLGLFLDRDEILRRSSLEMTDALLGLASVQVLNVGPERAVVFQDGARPGRPLEEWCGPTLWIDGAPVSRPEGGPTRLNRFVHPEEVVGIEVYRRPAELPLQYGGLRQGCGAILVWTR